jgi:hypothetical protein
MGIGPIRIIAPPPVLLSLRFESEPTVINKIPIKITAKAANNSHVAQLNGYVVVDPTF